MVDTVETDKLKSQRARTLVEAKQARNQSSPSPFMVALRNVSLVLILLGAILIAVTFFVPTDRLWAYQEHFKTCVKVCIGKGTMVVHGIVVLITSVSVQIVGLRGVGASVAKKVKMKEMVVPTPIRTSIRIKQMETTEIDGEEDGEESEEKREREGRQWKEVKSPAARKAVNRGRSPTKMPKGGNSANSTVETPTNIKSKGKVETKLSGSPSPASRTASRSKSRPRTSKKRDFIENDIVQNRPANHDTIEGDVRAWNADEDPVHPRKKTPSRSTKKPRASSRQRD